MAGKGKRAEVELDWDGELGAAISALREASWRLGIASFKLEEEYCVGDLAPRQWMDTGACMAIAEALASQVESVASQTRKLRKRAREI